MRCPEYSKTNACNGSVKLRRENAIAIMNQETIPYGAKNRKSRMILYIVIDQYYGYSVRAMPSVLQPFHFPVIALVGWLNRPLCASPNNFQVLHHSLIQQINRLLKPLVLHKCSVCFLSCLNRSMTEKMLNVSNGSASAQETSRKCLFQVM